MAAFHRSGRRTFLALLGGFAIAGGIGDPAKATDEIQVYNGAIAEVGQLTIQQHLNYAPVGKITPPFAGGLASNHSLNGTPEFAYGVTDWWELGLYLPFSVANQTFYSDAFKVRTLFVSPHADKRNFFYGVNFEFSNETPHFAQTRWGMEIRPIIGVRNSEYEFIINPIVDIGFGKYGEADFAPAARVARNFGNDVYAGFEYYADLGRIGNFAKLSDQQHTLFAVTDFKVGAVDVNFGVGYGLTPHSDRWVVKTIIGYALPVAGEKPSDTKHPFTGPINPMSRLTQRSW